jgi:hypothetical protein
VFVIASLLSQASIQGGHEQTSIDKGWILAEGLGRCFVDYIHFYTAGFALQVVECALLGAR